MPPIWTKPLPYRRLFWRAVNRPVLFFNCVVSPMCYSVHTSLLTCPWLSCSDNLLGLSFTVLYHLNISVASRREFLFITNCSIWANQKESTLLNSSVYLSNCRCHNCSDQCSVTATRCGLLTASCNCWLKMLCFKYSVWIIKSFSWAPFRYFITFFLHDFKHTNT